MNKKSPLYVLGFMVIISIVFGSAIAIVYNLTLKTTRQNEVLNRNRTIAKAFGLPVASSTASSYEIAVAQTLDRITLEGEGRNMEGFIRKGGSRNVAFVFSGVGFWDVISGLLVLSPDLSTVVGIGFFEQHETPGLGARIEEPWFIGQFAGKTIDWEAAGDKKIIIGPGSKGQRNRVDAITGATQTSMALMRTLNRDLARFRKAFDKQAGGPGKEGVDAWR